MAQVLPLNHPDVRHQPRGLAAWVADTQVLIEVKSRLAHPDAPEYKYYPLSKTRPASNFWPVADYYAFFLLDRAGHAVDGRLLDRSERVSYYASAGIRGGWNYRLSFIAKKWCYNGRELGVDITSALNQQLIAPLSD